MSNNFSLKELEKIHKHQELIFRYYDVEVPEELQTKLEVQIEKMRSFYFDQETLKGILKNKQTFEGISHVKELDLVSKLRMLQLGKFSKGKGTKKLSVVENKIYWEYSDESDTYHIIFAFTDMTDLRTFKLVEYEHHLSYTPGTTTPHPSEGSCELGTALVIMFDRIIVETSLVF